MIDLVANRLETGRTRFESSVGGWCCWYRRSNHPAENFTFGTPLSIADSGKCVACVGRRNSRRVTCKSVYLQPFLPFTPFRRELDNPRNIHHAQHEAAALSIDIKLMISINALKIVLLASSPAFARCEVANWRPPKRRHEWYRHGHRTRRSR